MHDFQEHCQVHGQRSKNMAYRKYPAYDAIMCLSLFPLKQCVTKQLSDNTYLDLDYSEYHKNLIQ